MTEKQGVPIDVVSLLPILDKKLVALLKSLTGDEWQKQTIAKRWVVKDVVAHLLDGNMRVLSLFRDNYFGEKPEIKSYQDLVDFLNGLNADWVKAMKRVSPEVLIFLHEITGPMYCNYYASLDPFEKALWAVDWAGESESKNWMHIAREYTEKWLHQQQIRDAVGKPGLMTRDLFYPFINVFMLALPHTYRNVPAESGTTVRVNIPTDIGGSWFLTRTEENWILGKKEDNPMKAEITIEPDIAWKLFSKSLRPEHVKDKIQIIGDTNLAEVALTMVSVMA